MNYNELVVDFNKKRAQELALMDCLASALSVNSIFKNGGIDYASITPEMEEAFSLQYPNMKISDIENYSEDEVIGIVNGWKGKLFEVNLRDGLNEGKNIGGIQLDFNQTAELAESPTNPGFDLFIRDDNSGQIVKELQAKATDNITYIKESIQKYPDYDIIATEEAAEDLGSNFDSISEINGVEIHNARISNEELTEEIESVISDKGIDILAFSFLLVPIIRHGRKYLIGRYTAEKAVSSFVKDSSKSAVAIAGGGLIALLGVGAGVGALAAFAIRLSIRNEDKLWGDLNRYNNINDKDIWGDLNRYKNIDDKDIW